MSPGYEYVLGPQVVHHYHKVTNWPQGPFHPNTSCDSVRHMEGQDTEQEEQPKPRNVGHLHLDMRNLRLLPKHKFPLQQRVRYRDACEGRGCFAPFVGGLLPHVSDSWLDSKTQLVLSAIKVQYTYWVTVLRCWWIHGIQVWGQLQSDVLVT